MSRFKSNVIGWLLLLVARGFRTYLKNASNTQELCYRPLQNVLLIPPSAGLRFFIGRCLTLERDLIFLRYVLERYTTSMFAL